MELETPSGAVRHPANITLVTIHLLTVVRPDVSQVLVAAFHALVAVLAGDVDLVDVRHVIIQVFVAGKLQVALGAVTPYHLLRWGL